MEGFILDHILWVQSLKMKKICIIQITWSYVTTVRKQRERWMLVLSFSFSSSVWDFNPWIDATHMCPLTSISPIWKLSLPESYLLGNPRAAQVDNQIKHHISCGSHRPSPSKHPLPTHSCMPPSNTSRHSLWTQWLSRPVKQTTHSHHIIGKWREKTESKKQNIRPTKIQKSAPRSIIITNLDA